MPGVPIVPAVSIGGQESQLYLTRGTWLAEAARTDRARGAHQDRADLVRIPVRAQRPVIPPNVPLPTKIVTQVLEPIDIVAEFGENPDIDEVDAHVRACHAAGARRTRRERRLPVLG